MDLFGGFSCKKIYIFLFYALLFFLTIALSIKYNIVDYDLWARLIQGKYVFLHHTPMKEDIISYTKTHVWYDPEWFLSGIIYFFNSKFSFNALIYLKGICCFLMICTIIQALKVRNKNTNPYTFGFYIFVLLCFIQSGILFFTFRCQLLTFILIGVWILLLEKIKRGDNYILFFLPLIMLLWLNCHGGSIAGAGILFIYVIGEFLNKNDYKKFLIAFIFCCLVYLINPWGIDFIKFIVESSYLDRSWISEWQSPFNSEFLDNYVYKFLLFAGIISYIYKIYKFKLTYSDINKTKLLIIFLLACLSAKYIKHVGLFIMIYTIFLYDDYSLLYNDLMEKLRNYLEFRDKTMNILIRIKNIVLYFLVFIYSFYIYYTIPVKFSYFDSTFRFYPVYAVEFLRVNKIKGKIFAPFYISTYSAYKLYPDNKIYMDGRQEQVYSIEQFDNSMFFLHKLGYYPEKIIDENDIDIFLLEKGYGANLILDENKNYIKIFADNKYSIYIKKNLAKFNYIAPSKDKNYYIENLFKTNI